MSKVRARPTTIRAMAAMAFLALGAGGAMAQTCASYPNTLTNGQTADANQVMANFGCAALLGAANFTAPVALGSATEKLSLNTASIGFNRRVQDGLIYNTSVYAYQIQHSGSSTQSSDFLDFQVYSPSGASVQPTALTLSAYGYVGVGLNQTSYNFYVNGTSGGVYGWTTTSDGRLKTQVQEITGALDLVERLRGVRFRWLPEQDRAFGRDLRLPSEAPQVGFIAQEVAQVAPEAVVEPRDPDHQPYGVMETKLIPILVEAIKEQQKEIDDLKAQVATLARR